MLDGLRGLLWVWWSWQVRVWIEALDDEVDCAGGWKDLWMGFTRLRGSEGREMYTGFEGR